jgi:hypothetical protein
VITELLIAWWVKKKRDKQRQQEAEHAAKTVDTDTEQKKT